MKFQETLKNKKYNIEDKRNNKEWKLIKNEKRHHNE
jgi:hypothetical protein